MILKKTRDMGQQNILKQLICTVQHLSIEKHLEYVNINNTYLITI